MKKRPFDRCLRAVPTMTSAQRHDLKILIERRDKKDLVAEAASLVGTPTACPHCHHPEIRPWGHAAGLHRYRCQGCKRTFGPLTTTPLAGLHHKDRWMFFLEKFSEGESVRKAAWRCGINTKAAFLWRHRFLALPANLKAREENGIVETDETWWRVAGEPYDPQAPEEPDMTLSRHPARSDQSPGRSRHGRNVFFRTFARLTNRSVAQGWGELTFLRTSHSVSPFRISTDFFATVQHVDVCSVSREVILPCGATSMRPVTVAIRFFHDPLPAAPRGSLALPLPADHSTGGTTGLPRSP